MSSASLIGEGSGGVSTPLYGSVSSRSALARYFSSERDKYEIGKPYVSVVLGRIFKLREREATVQEEIKAGFVHFVSVAFILAVNPTLLSSAGYDKASVSAATCLATGLACVLSGIVSNLPFVVAPTTSTSLYFAVFLQNRGMSQDSGNFAIFLLGLLFLFLSLRKVAVFTSNLVPFVLKAGICLGVGMLIALDALTEIGMVETGTYTILSMGRFTSKIWISILAFVAIALLMSARVKGAFVIGIMLGSILYWLGHPEDWPEQIFVETSDIKFYFPISFDSAQIYDVLRLVVDLLFIGVILLNGLAHGLCEMAKLRRSDGTIPRGKWLYALCGAGTILSSVVGSGPFLISPESAPGLKAGARTGLSVVVCGILFLLSVIFAPLLASAPATGTSPVLLMIGTMLFENAGKVNWGDVRESIPIFLVTALVPFTYSLFYGVIFGLCMHLVFKIFSRRFWKNNSPEFVYNIISSVANWLYPDSIDDVRGFPGEDESEPINFDNPQFNFGPLADPRMEHQRLASTDSDILGHGYRGFGLGSVISAPKNGSTVEVAGSKPSSDAYLDTYDSHFPEELTKDALISRLSHGRDWEDEMR